MLDAIDDESRSDFFLQYAVSLESLPIFAHFAASLQLSVEWIASGISDRFKFSHSPNSLPILRLRGVYMTL